MEQNFVVFKLSDLQLERMNLFGLESDRDRYLVALQVLLLQRYSVFIQLLAYGLILL